VKSNCIDSLSIQLVAGFAGIYFRELANLQELNACKNFMFYTNSTTAKG